jgi:hypothetical protein
MPSRVHLDHVSGGPDRRRLAGAIAAAAFAALMPAWAAAMPIVGVSQTRSVSATAVNFCAPPPISDSESATGFAPTALTAIAQAGSGSCGTAQASAQNAASLGPHAISVDLDISGFGPPLGGNISTESILDLYFDVTDTVPYRLDRLAGGQNIFVEYELLLTGPTGTIIHTTFFRTEGPRTGTLVPGAYHLYARLALEQYPENFARSWGIDVDLTIVPEPASGWMLGVGLAALAWGRRSGARALRVRSAPRTA